MEKIKNLASLPRDEALAAARDAGRAVLTDSKAVSSVFLTLWTEWMQENIPRACGQSDDEFGQLLSDMMKSFDLGMDEFIASASCAPPSAAYDDAYLAAREAAGLLEKQAAEILNMRSRDDRQARTIASLYQAKSRLEREVSRLSSQIASPSTEINQCDGCRVGAPLTIYGHHAMPGGGFMACSKNLYGSLPDERTAYSINATEPGFEEAWPEIHRAGFNYGWRGVALASWRLATARAEARIAELEAVRITMARDSMLVLTAAVLASGGRIVVDGLSMISSVDATLTRIDLPTGEFEMSAQTERTAESAITSEGVDENPN